MKHWTQHIILLVFTTAMFTVLGQRIQTHVDEKQVQIGEPFTLTYSIQTKKAIDSIRYDHYDHIFPGKMNVSADTLGITKPYDVEIIEQFSDTTYTENDSTVWKGKYRLVAWDSAYVVLPPERVYLNDSLHYFPAQLVAVSSPNADPGKPLRDIHEEFTEVPETPLGVVQFLNTHWWWMALVVLAVIILIVLRFRKQKKDVIQPISLRHEFIQKIDELESSKRYEEDLKEYYYDLSLLLRRFFARHYRERVLDKTSREVEFLLAQKNVERETIQVVSKILNQSDMVKFARSTPPVSDVFVITEEARRVVNEIADLDLDQNE